MKIKPNPRVRRNDLRCVVGRLAVDEESVAVVSRARRGRGLVHGDDGLVLVLDAARLRVGDLPVEVVGTGRGVRARDVRVDEEVGVLGGGRVATEFGREAKVGWRDGFWRV